ncbi:CBS domain-containing protein [Nitrospira sp. Nam80]
MTELPEPQVREYMHRQLDGVPPSVSVARIADMMRRDTLGSVLVESVDHVKNETATIGIVTETDLVRKVVAQGRDPARTTVSEVMASPLITIAPDRPMLEASHVMEKHRIRHLAVSDGKEVLGLISVRDLVRHFVEADHGPVQALNDVYQPLGVLMQRTIETIRSDESVAASATRMLEKQIGSLVVREDNEIVGIVTEADIVRKLLAHQLDPNATRVGAIMNSPILDIDINRTVRDASELMTKHRIRHLAVTDHGKTVGILSVRDLVKMVSIRDRPQFLRRTGR